MWGSIYDQRKIPLHLFTIGFQKPGICADCWFLESNGKMVQWDFSLINICINGYSTNSHTDFGLSLSCVFITLKSVFFTLMSVTKVSAMKEGRIVIFCLFYCHSKISVVQSNRTYDLKNSKLCVLTTGASERPTRAPPHISSATNYDMSHHSTSIELCLSKVIMRS